MREVRREVEIDAPPSAVWAVLSDTRSYPDWNPFIRRLEGDLREGAKLSVLIEPPGARAMTLKPTVLAVIPERELRWLGRFLIPGLCDGGHSVRIEPTGDGRTRFTQAETFTGILVPALKGTLVKVETGFEQMNEALKSRAEAQ